MDQKFDTIVIGFGKAGKTLAAKLAKQGEKVALIEKDARMYGGTCINVGCIPSKRLVLEAERAPAHDFEVQSEYYHVAVQEKKKLTTALRMANYNKLIDAGVQVINGTASFLDGKTIGVKGAHGTMQTLSASKLIINTGGRPMIPAVPGVENNRLVFTSETMMENETLPRRLTIIGGGYIGLEFASMYAGFGSKVTILEGGNKFMPREDRDIANSVKEVMEKKGIEIHLNARAQSIHDTNDGVTLTYSDISDGTPYYVDGDAILIATGRKPMIEGLNLQAAGIGVDAHGAIIVNDQLRTTVPHIWAMGDVKGGSQFTYLSLDDFRIIRDQLFGDKKRDIGDRDPVQYAVFIDPPLAHIGISEEEALKRGYSFKVSRLPASSIVRTRTLRQTDGMLKAIINNHNGKIMGCTLFCADASEIINIVAMAIKTGQTSTFLRDFIFTHPSMSEGLNQLFDV